METKFLIFNNCCRPICIRIADKNLHESLLFAHINDVFSKGLQKYCTSP